MSAIQTNAFIAVQRPVSASAVATAAETAFHAPTQAVELIDPAENIQGLRITKAYAITRAAPAAAVNCQLYEWDGTSHILIDSAVLANTAPGASVASVKAAFDASEDAPLFLRPGVGLAFAIGSAVANGVVCRVSGGAYDPLP